MAERWIEFTKMHGAGNDYIYVDTMAQALEEPERRAAEWSVAHTGIGADGLVLISKSEKADFGMRIFNADGSEAMMCGNATRCIGKYVYEAGLTQKKEITLETLSGIKELELTVEGEEVKEVTVDMGTPEVLEKELKAEAAGRKYTGTAVSMGNPHLVIFDKDVKNVDLPAVGSALETHPYFPSRTNVEIVEVIHPEKLKMRVWERGSGVTQACGTGACAAVVAGVATGRTGRNVTVLMDGGELQIVWDEVSGKVRMSGDAVKVFEGRIRVS
ncbi:MAG: diaminopimelate epimerase [Tannerellaceae bacterium]|jgi:diaminopimelate epimerase|nr:diaminopimelate epimerase [Tannerellaceae bacterium]